MALLICMAMQVQLAMLPAHKTYEGCSAISFLRQLDIR